MEETHKNKLSLIAKLHMHKHREVKATEVGMSYWDSTVLQGQREQLTFKRNGLAREDACRRSQRTKKKLMAMEAPHRLPRLRSTTFPLDPARTLLHHSVRGSKRSRTTANIIPSDSMPIKDKINLKTADVLRHIDAKDTRHVHQTAISIAFEENDLRRRIEEEKRKQRQLQRSFEIARKEHQQERLHELRQLERERERLRAEVQCRVKSEHHLSRMLFQQGLHIASPSIARLQNARLVAEHQGEIVETTKDNKQIKLESNTESNQMRLQWELMKRPTRK